MNEAMKRTSSQFNFRRRLLTTVSAFALASAGAEARAEGAFLASDTPSVWIELGGQFDMLTGAQTKWMPPLDSPAAGSGTFIQKSPLYGYDADASLSYISGGGDWRLNLTVRYGRSLYHNRFHTQILAIPPIYPSHPAQYAQEAYDANSSVRANHMIADFQAGKDVGLGLSESRVSVGVRFAQFNARTLDMATDFPARGYYPPLYHRRFSDTADIHRNLWALGPSLSWDASASLARSGSRMFSFDWGANGAVLFGRQKANTHIVSVYQKVVQNEDGIPPITRTTDTPHIRDKQVIVPNLGGFAGFSVRWPAAKISIGYRGDFFFGAMDGGMDTRKSEDVGFYGPFASISIGLGE